MNMEYNYDVIVVGAGNSGLAAAATAAKSGLKTLLIEKNPIPGGSATSFRRGRFEFESSLHELANIGTEENPGSVRKMFESLGVNINWHLENTAFRAVVTGENGYDVTAPLGVDAFCEAIERVSPGSLESVKRVFEIADEIGRALEYLSKGKPDVNVLAKEYPDFLRAASHTTEECLNALGMPKKAQSILCTYWSYLGADVSKIDFMHYILMLDRYVRFGAAMPHMRSHELSLGLEKAVRDNGGEIWYNSAVSQVLVKDSVAYGVKVNGKELYAKNIVLNCNPDVAYAKMISPEHIPEDAVKLSNAREINLPFFTVYLGLNRSAEELGIKDYSVFLFDSQDSKEQYDSVNSIDNSFSIINCLNCVVPEASPKGTCMLFFTTLLNEKIWENLSPQDYKKLKNKIAQRLISDYETKLGLSVKPYIEEIVIATPATFARYLGTPNGTPYGYEMNLWDSMIARIMNAKKEQFIDNLFFAGAHGERGDGYSSTYANGVSVAKSVIAKEAAK